jgi:hypothetical protein
LVTSCLFDVNWRQTPFNGRPHPLQTSSSTLVEVVNVAVEVVCAVVEVLDAVVVKVVVHVV